MLDIGHFDLNSVQFCSDSSQERLKQTMLNQELVFMGQVFDLHQLYRIQIAMTEEIKQRGLDYCNSHVGGSNSRPVNSNNRAMFSMSDIQCRNPTSKKKSLDLQLSADEFITQAANDSSGVFRGFPIESKNFFQDTIAFDLNHSVSIDEDTGVKHRSLMGRQTRGSRPDIIDLEDPNLSFLNNDVGRQTCGIPFPNSCLKDKHKLERFILGGKHHVQSLSQNRSRHIPFSDVGVTSQRQALGKSGFNRDFVANDTSVSRGRINLDLNTGQLEDLSCFSNTHSGVINPVATAFSTITENNYSQATVASSVSLTSWRESNGNDFTEIPNVHVQNSLELGRAENLIGVPRTTLSRGGKPKDNGSKIIIIDLDSDSGEELFSTREEPKIESVGSTSKLSNGLSCEIEMGEAVGEEAVIEKDAKPLTLLLSARNSMVDSNFSSCDKNQIVDTGLRTSHSEVLEHRSSESPDSNICRINDKEVLVDGTAQKAAELLVKLSRQRPTNRLSGLGKINSRFCHRKGRDRPQCSSESYEEMVVNAKECGPDDYCISSNAMVVDVTEKKDNRYKLKRGTRMKDFQKEILSSLSTLSRHEIREDIKIFETVVKSREYKKMRAKMGYGSDWCSPTKTKRSRISRR